MGGGALGVAVAASGSLRARPLRGRSSPMALRSPAARCARDRYAVVRARWLFARLRLAARATATRSRLRQFRSGGGFSDLRRRLAVGLAEWCCLHRRETLWSRLGASRSVSGVLVGSSRTREDLPTCRDRVTLSRVTRRSNTRSHRRIRARLCDARDSANESRTSDLLRTRCTSTIPLYPCRAAAIK